MNIFGKKSQNIHFGAYKSLFYEKEWIGKILGTSLNV